MSLRINVLVQVEVDRQRWAEAASVTGTDDDVRPLVVQHIRELVGKSSALEDGRLLRMRTRWIKGLGRLA